MSAIDDYFDDVSRRLSSLAETQRGNLDHAAEVCARAIVERRPLHILDTGHLIGHEFIARTGGLAAYTTLEFTAELTRENDWLTADRSAPDPTGETSARLLVEWLFAQGTLIAGDPLIISSVSGTGRLAVELALQARHRGLTVIAVTGADFSASLTSQHSSGMRLRDVADIVLDDQVPDGDAALVIDGFPHRVGAWSGVSGVLLMWALTVGIVERCVAAGVELTVFTSVNLPGGPAAYEAARARYRADGR